MIIINTLECNEKCSYCNVFKKKTSFLLLTEKSYDTIIAILELEKKKYWKNNIRFFWGEAFLGVHNIIELIEGLFQRKADLVLDKVYINTNLLFPFKYLQPHIERLLSILEEHNTELILITTFNWKTHSLDRNVNDKQKIMIENTIFAIKETFPSINFVNNIVITDNMIKEFYDSGENIEDFVYPINKLFWDKLLYANFLPLAYTECNRDERYEDFIKELSKTKIFYSVLDYRNNYFVEQSSLIPLFPNDIILLYNGDISYNLVTIEKLYKCKLKELNIFNNTIKDIVSYIEETFFDKEYLKYQNFAIHDKLRWFFGDEIFDKTLQNYIIANNYYKE